MNQELQDYVANEAFEIDPGEKAWVLLAGEPFQHHAYVPPCEPLY